MKWTQFLLVCSLLCTTCYAEEVKQSTDEIEAKKVANTDVKAELEKQEAIDLGNLKTLPDNLEPFNRGVFSFNEFLLKYIADPILSGYNFIVPESARESISNFYKNILFPVRFINNGLQGEWEDAEIELKRFSLNTTVGILGFFDPASKQGLRTLDEDTGLTFQKWGWEDPNYLVLPALGPSSTRDALGKIPDYFMSPPTYINEYMSPVLAANELSLVIDTLVDQLNTDYDAYDTAKILYSLIRIANQTMEKEAKDRAEGKTETEIAITALTVDERPSTGAQQSIFSMYNKPRTKEFMKKPSSSKIQIEGIEEELPYSHWIQKFPAPIVYIVPGFGSHRNGRSVKYLAETYFNQGFSVVSVSSTMNWEFLRFGSDTVFPGYGPRDAEDMLNALTIIDNQLREKHPGLIQKKAVVGFSLGGYQVMLMASMDEEQREKYVKFDRYVALNAPVDIISALNKLDSYYKELLAIPLEERAHKIKSLLIRSYMASKVFNKIRVDQFFVVNEKGDRVKLKLSDEPVPNFPVNETQEKFLTGLYFRLTLSRLAYVTQTKEDIGILPAEISKWSRRENYNYLVRYINFSDYQRLFIEPYFAREDEGGITPEQLTNRSNVKFHGDKLKANGQVRLILNKNDFVISVEDIAWLEEKLGKDNVQTFEMGGHMGNYGTTEFRKALLHTVRDLRAYDKPKELKK